MSWEPKERRTTLLEHEYADGSGYVEVQEIAASPPLQLIAVSACHVFGSDLVKTLAHATANAVYSVGALQEGDWEPLFNEYMTYLIRSANRLRRAENPLSEFEWVLRVAPPEDAASGIVVHPFDFDDGTEVP